MTMRNFYIKTLPLVTLMLLTNSLSQLPIKLNHPASIIIKRLSAQGKISLEYFGKNSMSSINVNQILDKSSYKSHINSLWNITVPTKNISKDSINETGNIAYLYDNMLKSNLNIEKKYFYQSASDSSLMWIKIRENILSQSQKDNKSFQYVEDLRFNGIFYNRLYVSTIFSMFRHSGNQILISNNYKNEWTKYFQEINMTFCYLNNTSLYLKTALVDIEIANNPFSWGWSSGNSPILSAKAAPFNRVSLYKSFGKLNFEYFHGNIIDRSVDEVHNQNIKKEKFIAGHRAQFKISNDLYASISELVIYGNRSPELSYINPISFFWAQEHNLGDLDNILIAADLGYRFIPGCIIYNTLLLDELSWKDIFNNWWGNKFSYQFGLYLTSKNITLPDLRIEYTATRPWTYTHPDFSYSHRQIPLGSPNGPSSKTLLIESFFFPTSRTILYGSFEHALKGIGEGSGLLDNYDNRDIKYDWDTEFLLENKTSSDKFKFDIQYLISMYLKLRGTIIINHTAHPEIMSGKINETEKTFIVGIDFNW